MTARPAWLVLGAVAAVVSILYGLASITGLLAWDSYRVHRSFTGEVESVVVDADGGAVRLVRGADDGARVDMKVIRGLRRPEHVARLEDGVLRVDTGCPALFSTYCTVSSTITVPRGVDVTVRASGGGIRVRGIDGGLDLDSSGGGIHVDGGDGPMRLRSSGGGITAIRLVGSVDASSSGGGVRLEFAENPIAVKARSSGGGITIVVPRNRARYVLRTRSSGGSVRNDVRTDPFGLVTIDASSSGGGVTVRYPE